MVAAAVVLGLSAAQKTGLGVAAGVLIVFAVAVAYVIPERWPDFPGHAGLRPFIAASAALFVGMMLAVFFIAKEEESAAGEHGTGATESAAHVSQVTGVDYEIQLSESSVESGSYVFEFTNDGEEVHNLAVDGPGVSGKETPTIDAGKTAKLEVELQPGTYELYCSVPGHRELGMTADLDVT